MKISRPHPRHDHRPLIFPKGFLWGAATSSHQVEGENIYNDWWGWEQRQPPEKRSGLAADQYHLFPQDFQLAKSLGHNSHRLSLEWSRIEPIEGQFNQEAIDHYKLVLKSLKEKDLLVMLTLWHFTIPQWLAAIGGWENPKAIGYFERFVKRVVPEYKEYVSLWVTLNEPGVYAFQSYLMGIWPPQKKSKLSTIKVYKNLAKAHKKAYQIIHSQVAHAKVGIANNVSTFEAFHKHAITEILTEWGLDYINHLFYKLSGIKTHDFLGLNYYFNQYISLNQNKRLPTLVDISTTHKEVSDMGWEIFPEGIYSILMDFSDYKLPIYITENGLASVNDDRRVRFLVSYLEEIYHAIETGADVRGYFHWSLIDNFEWADGFVPRFGLIGIDYQTQKRIPKNSSLLYKEIILHNRIPHHFLKLLGHGIRVAEVLNEQQIDCKECRIILAKVIKAPPSRE
jgi:beta-glucosidase